MLEKLWTFLLVWLNSVAWLELMSKASEFDFCSLIVEYKVMPEKLINFLFGLIEFDGLARIDVKSFWIWLLLFYFFWL